MANKKKVSVTLDEDVVAWGRENPAVNLSGWLNEAARARKDYGDLGTAGLHLKRDELRDEVQYHAAQADAHRQKADRAQALLERLEARIDDVGDEVGEAVAEFLDLDIPEEHHNADNPAVQNHAAKAGISPAEFLVRIREERERGADE